MNNKINIGTASIILIFIILCLSVFALLGLSDARSAQVFAQRKADSVTNFYLTDAVGQTFIKEYRDALMNGQTAEQALKSAQDGLPEGAFSSFDEQGRIVCEIPMNAGQSLHIELLHSDASIRSYYVYNSEDYAIDTRLPVWTTD